MDWSVNPIFGSYSIIVLISLALMLLLILIQETGRLTRGQSIFLWSMRLAMCLLLIFVLLKPGITFTKQSAPGGTVTILLDESSSMQLGSGDGKLTRWEKQKLILDQIWNSRDELGSNSTWMPFLYGGSLRPLAQPGPKDVTIAVPANATEGVTDIGGPIGQLLTQSLESPLSAVIWMGDGSQTLVPSGGDPLQIARRLAQMDVPLYMVGIGPRADSENSKDLSIGGVPEQMDVFTKNQINIIGTVRSRGFANRPIAVGLYMKVEGQLDKPLARSVFTPTRNDESIPFQLGMIAPETGAYELLVRVDGEGDASLQNNASTVYLNVRKGGARILFVEGEARFEMKYIRSSVGESQDLTLTTRPIRKPPIQKWPVNFSEQLEGAAYDCIILGDVDFRAFDQIGADIIASQVKDGTGLITLGGYHSYASGGWGQSNAIREILPIQLPITRPSDDINAKINLAEHIPGPIKITVAGNNEILQLDSSGGTAVWETLPPLNGANRWTGIKNTPGTLRLANSTAGDPMIVTGQAGKGRVICLAFDSTYLWAREGKIAEHKAFWRQLIYSCMRRESVDEGMQIRMPQRRLILDKSSEAVLEWIGGSDNVEMPPNISMHLWKISENGADKNQPIDLGEVPMTKRDNKSWRALFPGSKEPGRYEWRAQTTRSTGQVIEAKLPFAVQDNSIESMQPIPDWSLMEQMARVNSSAGGMLVSPDQPQDIVKQLIERRKIATETIIENRRLGDGVIDSWITFLLLGGLMIAQWYLRKRWNLP